MEMTTTTFFTQIQQTMTTLPSRLYSDIQAIFETAKEKYASYSAEERKQLKDWVWTKGTELVQAIQATLSSTYELFCTILGFVSEGGGRILEASQFLALFYLPIGVYRIYHAAVSKESLLEKFFDISIEIGTLSSCAAFAINGLAKISSVFDKLAVAMPYLLGVSTVLGVFDLGKKTMTLQKTNALMEKHFKKEGNGHTILEELSDEELENYFYLRPNTINKFREEAKTKSSEQVYEHLKERILRVEESRQLQRIASVIANIASVLLLVSLVTAPAPPVALGITVLSYTFLAGSCLLTIGTFIADRRTEDLWFGSEEYMMRPLVAAA